MGMAGLGLASGGRQLMVRRRPRRPLWERLRCAPPWTGHEEGKGGGGEAGGLRGGGRAPWRRADTTVLGRARVAGGAWRIGGGRRQGAAVVGSHNLVGEE